MNGELNLKFHVPDLMTQVLLIEKICVGYKIVAQKRFGHEPCSHETHLWENPEVCRPTEVELQ